MIAGLLVLALGFTPTEPRRNFDQPIVLEIGFGQIQVRGTRCDVVRWMEDFTQEAMPRWQEIISPDQVEATRYGWGQCVPLIGLHDDEVYPVLGRHLRKWHGPIIWRRALREEYEEDRNTPW